ncbi:MAG: hypothetical protein IJF47_01555 [Candidatus Methanomethylophilaceae archaeon]|nr:hypothetical protein [Candidatus Methanomethylophilaceae archaeon]
MPDVQKVVEYLKSLTGVVKVIQMTDEMSNNVMDIEKSIKTQSQHDYDNIGYDLAMNKKHRLCLFFTDDLPIKMKSILKMITSDGTILGTSLEPDEIESYKGRDDIIWISEDFIMFTNIQGNGPESFVLYPYPVKELDAIAEKELNAIGTFPTSSSDMYLKECVDIPLTDNIFSTIIAFGDQL